MLRIIILTATLAVSLLPSGAARAQTYPDRPVRIIVPFAPGGGTDIIARVLAKKLGESLKTAFIVENRAGANANIGNELAARAKPDGYTLLMTSSALTINPSLFKTSSYDPLKDFAPISLATINPMLLAVNPSSMRVDSFKEFVEKVRVDGNSLNFGSAGPGNATQLAMELLKSVAHLEMTHIPYKGTGEAVVGLLSGQVQALWGTIPAVLPHVKQGQLKALAVSSSRRISAAPDIPTVAELGFPGYEAVTWFGLLAPAGTPRPIVALLSEEVRKALKAPEVADILSTQGGEPAGNTPEEFADYLKAEVAKWANVVTIAGIEKQ